MEDTTNQFKIVVKKSETKEHYRDLGIYNKG
jgi:hypothetical protein